MNLYELTLKKQSIDPSAKSTHGDIFIVAKSLKSALTIFRKQYKCEPIRCYNLSASRGDAVIIEGMEDTWNYVRSEK